MNVCESNKLRELYKALISVRRLKVQSKNLEALIINVIKAISEELNLKPPNIDTLKEVIARGGVIITAGEINGYLAIRVEIFSKLKRKVVQLRDKKLEEVDSIFFE